MVFKDDEGRTEKATPGKKSEARGKGNVPISRELTMAGSLLIAVLAVENLGGWLIGSFQKILENGLSVDRALELAKNPTKEQAMIFFREIAEIVVPPVATLMAIFVIATLLFGFGQIGIKFSPKALKMRLDKLNPVAGLGRIFSFASIFKALFSILKMTVLVTVLWFVLDGAQVTLAGLNQHTSFLSAATTVAGLALKIFFWVALIVMVLALADVAWQRYDHAKKLMMTKQEVEDERKRNDGDPFIKNRMKGARMEMFKQRVMQTVPKADVVITNPTHFSVAVKYDRMNNNAPEVVAKGIDELALKIREIAKEHDVPLMEDPPLARALYRAVKIGQEIPERFYKAVATVLGHVYRMKGEVA